MRRHDGREPKKIRYTKTNSYILLYDSIPCLSLRIDVSSHARSRKSFFIFPFFIFSFPSRARPPPSPLRRGARVTEDFSRVVVFFFHPSRAYFVFHLFPVAQRRRNTAALLNVFAEYRFGKVYTIYFVLRTRGHSRGTSNTRHPSIPPARRCSARKKKTARHYKRAYNAVI